MTTHALYRFFAADGQLLYVGITLNPGTRWPKHRDGKPWWSEVARVTLEVHPDRPSVLEAERVAIQTEGAKYNIQHQPRPGQQVDPTWIAEDMPDVCDQQPCEARAVYLPYRWVAGVGSYQCKNGHTWTCGWGHQHGGSAPEHAGVPAWEVPA